MKQIMLDTMVSMTIVLLIPLLIWFFSTQDFSPVFNIFVK